MAIGRPLGGVEVLMRLNNVVPMMRETSVAEGEKPCGHRSNAVVERLSGVVDLYVNDAFACGNSTGPAQASTSTCHLPCPHFGLPLFLQGRHSEIEALNREHSRPARRAWRCLAASKWTIPSGCGQHAPAGSTAGGGVVHRRRRQPDDRAAQALTIGAQNHDFLVRELWHCMASTIEMAKARARLW
ncbi:MAG: hypothetical protein CM15mP18_0680 [Methanobacteriota archaeon]|nr:MAG: hypothetical protein CM15mP18_0680 [Euryarchaeota archaeon]